MERHGHNLRLEAFLHRKLGPSIGVVALFILEVLQIVIISAAIIFPIRLYVIKPFYVKGASMEPNFYDHEYLIIDELSYRFRPPQRGEIVVFLFPFEQNDWESSQVFYIKRLIGLPGETVEVKDGKVYIYNEEFPNGEVLDEPYIDVPTGGKKKITLGVDEYFVLGDNRGKSQDSRFFGFVPKKAVVGRVVLRGLPLSRIHVFETPDY